METANLKNELASLQKTIADGAVQFDVKGIKTKIAARQLIGMRFCLMSNLSLTPHPVIQHSLCRFKGDMSVGTRFFLKSLYSYCYAYCRMNSVL